MSSVDVDGLRIAFTRAGDGPPVVLLGGFVGDRTATWRSQIDALSTACTVVAWDAPGSGESADVLESFRMPDYADCLAGLLSALKLEQPVLVGLSFGGSLALEFYRRHRSQVRGLFLAGAYAGWAGSLPPDIVRQRLAASIQSSHLPPEEFVAALLPSMFSAAAPKDRVDAFGANMAANFRPAGFRAMAFASAEADLRDVLPLIDVPTVVLRGENDIRAPKYVAAALHEAIPTSQLVVLSQAGHVSCVEAPEQFTAEVQAFLRGQQFW